MRLSILFIFLFLGCQSGISVVKDSDRLIRDVYGEKYVKVYSIYRNSDKRFYILQNGKVIHKDLKFIKILDKHSSDTSHNHQVIDEQNHKKTLIVDSDIKFHRRMMCGTAFLMANHYWFKSKREPTGDFLVSIEMMQGNIPDTKKIKTVSLKDTKDMDEILFVNMKNIYDFGDFSNYGKKVATSPYTLIYKKGKKFGILGKLKYAHDKNQSFILTKTKSEELYDNISSVNGVLLVKRNGLLGYYEVTEVKYKSLEPFDIYLARFELPDGRKGYVDIEGNEYFDSIP